MRILGENRGEFDMPTGGENSEPLFERLDVGKKRIIGISHRLKNSGKKKPLKKIWVLGAKELGFKVDWEEKVLICITRNLKLPEKSRGSCEEHGRFPRLPGTCYNEFDIFWRYFIEYVDGPFLDFFHDLWGGCDSASNEV